MSNQNPLFNSKEYSTSDFDTTPSPVTSIQNNQNDKNFDSNKTDRKNEADKLKPENNHLDLDRLGFGTQYALYKGHRNSHLPYFSLANGASVQISQAQTDFDVFKRHCEVHQREFERVIQSLLNEDPVEQSQKAQKFERTMW